MKNSIYKDYPELINDLDQVSLVINQQLDSEKEEFSKVVKQTFNKNSKLIRPALVLIGASYNHKVKNKAINLAAALEMMHVASLIHDDIIDEAKLRRSQVTINEQFDNGYAVICGDYLFSKSFQLIFETQDLKGISLMGNNVTKMIFGEVEQYLTKFNQDISIDNYLSIIEKKTASFFMTSLVLGAHLAKVNEKEIKILEHIGLNLGLLFQIQDDLLDFDHQETIGKSSNSDLKRGTYSLPIIIALQSSNKLKEHLKQENLDYPYIFEILDETKAIYKTKEYIESYYDKTISLINSLSNVIVQEQLTNLITKLIKRTY